MLRRLSYLLPFFVVGAILIGCEDNDHDWHRRDHDRVVIHEQDHHEPDRVIVHEEEHHDRD